MKDFLYSALVCCGLSFGLSVSTSFADDIPAALPSSEVSTNTWNKPPAAAATQETGPTAAQQLLLQAMGLIGVRYKWGGNNPEDGLDCSGFVRYVFQNSLNIALPHNAFAMSRIGETVDRTELRPGDLVFFNTLGRTFSHVGIYMGDDRFIHSPRAGRSVETARLDESYWQKRWNGARRIADAKGESLNLAGLLAMAGNPAAAQIDRTGKTSLRCKKTIQGRGKKKRTIMVCERTGNTKPQAVGKPSKPAKVASKSAKVSKSATKPKAVVRKKTKH